MAVLEPVVAVVLHGALGLWIGTITFFSFVGAPTTFRALNEEYAGKVVNATFPTYYVLGTGYAAVGFLAGIARGQLAGYDLALGIVFLGTIVGGGADLYARYVLIPKMEAAGDDAFDRYHGRSVALNVVTLAAAVVAFVAAHL